MKRLFFLALCIGVFLVNINLYADEATRRALTEDYMALFKMPQLVENLEDQFKPLLLALLEKENIPSDKKQIADKCMDKCWDIINKELIWENLKDQYIQLYMKYYSESELHDIIQFYKSPVGKKVIELMPQLMKEGNLIGQKFAQDNIIPKLKAQFEEMEKEIQKQN